MQAIPSPAWPIRKNSANGNATCSPPIIRERALAWAVAYADVAEIDSLNILQATLLAMRRAVLALHVQPQQVLVDGLYCPQTGIPSRAIIKGDSKIAEISAASILAKTARDALMLQLHEQYPHYGFAGAQGISDRRASGRVARTWRYRPCTAGASGRCANFYPLSCLRERGRGEGSFEVSYCFINARTEINTWTENVTWLSTN